MKDELKKFLAYNEKFVVICTRTTELVEKAKQIHDLSPVATATFGRVLTMGCMMGAQMKSQKNKLTIQIKGNGPLGTIIVTTNNFPRVKGCVTNPRIDLPLNEDGKLDVGQAVGNYGFINVVKDLGLKEPYIGICPLSSGEIAEDFANYYVQSEQKQTAVGLGVLINKDGVKSSGGYLIQPMPDATQEEISNVEKAIFEAGAVSKLLDQNISLEELAKRVTGDENIKLIEDIRYPIYECDCSKEYMAEGIKTLPEEELKEIIEEDEKAEITCHFCNKKYNFSKQELEQILNNKKS